MKGDNYHNPELNKKHQIAEDFEPFLELLLFDESLQNTAYQYGTDLEAFPRKEVA